MPNKESPPDDDAKPKAEATQAEEPKPEEPKAAPKKKASDMGRSLKDVAKSAAASKARPVAGAEEKAAAAEPGKTVTVGGESFVDRVLPHMKKIIVTIIVITVVLSGVFGYRSYQESTKEKATDKLVEVINVGDR